MYTHLILKLRMVDAFIFCSKNAVGVLDGSRYVKYEQGPEQKRTSRYGKFESLISVEIYKY
jgi:hypothetical protein